MSAEFIVAIVGFMLLILAWVVLPIRHAAPLSEADYLPATNLLARNEPVREMRSEEALA